MQRPPYCTSVTVWFAQGTSPDSRYLNTYELTQNWGQTLIAEMLRRHWKPRDPVRSQYVAYKIGTLPRSRFFDIPRFYMSLVRTYPARSEPRTEDRSTAQLCVHMFGCGSMNASPRARYT